MGSSYEYTRSPRNKYSHQRYRAGMRGVEFLLTFEDWMRLWAPYWHNRGNLSGQFVMARKGDKGAYKLGNVEIKTQNENARDRKTNRSGARGQIVGTSKLKDKDIPRIRSALARKEPKTQIAARYGVSGTAIHYIATGRNWSGF